nr:CsiV family protein [Echinimonas agarilytica]
MKHLLAPIIISSLIAPAAHARWFEVEILLFSRTQDPTQIDEDFENIEFTQSSIRKLDLIAPMLLAPSDCPEPEPIAVPVEEGAEAPIDTLEAGVEYDEFGFPIEAPIEPAEPEVVMTPEERVAHEQWLSECTKPRSYDELSQLPVTMTQHVLPPDDSSPYLLTPELLQLNDAVAKLNRSGSYKPMLHTGWRMDITSKRSMPAIKLVGGQNFGSRYTSDGWEHAIEEPQDIENNIETLDDSEALGAAVPGAQETDTELVGPSATTDGLDMLGDALLPNWDESSINAPVPEVFNPAVWELDADVRVWLATWLHIDTQITLRRSGRKSPQEISSTDEQTVSTGTLVSDAATVPYLYQYHLDQFRRVRSKEIHYFDHPLMGMIIQIRPYEKRPDIEPNTPNKMPVAE